MPLPVQHALLPPLVVLRVHELPRLVLLHPVEYPIELPDGHLNLVPCLIQVLPVRRGDVQSVGTQLSVHLPVGLVHGIQLLVSLLQAIQLVGRVHQNPVRLIRVHMNVYVGGGDRLDGVAGSVSEPVGQRHVDRHIFLGYVEVGECGEHE